MSGRVRGVRRFLVLMALPVVAVTATMAGCKPEGSGEPVPLPSATGTAQAIAKENLEYLWPFSVDNGTIECREGKYALFVAPDGTAYALNREASRKGFDDIDPIRRNNRGGIRISLGAVRSKALELCSNQ